MHGTLRLLQLLSMAVWAGGLVFFAFVLAPTAFHTLPSVHLAGAIVGAALRAFNPIAMGAGAVFLLASAGLFRSAPMRIRGRYEMEFLLAGIMLLGTAYIHWNLLPRMDDDMRQAGGDISTAAPTNPAKIHFDKLHIRSERLEGVILFLGLGVLFLMSREHGTLEHDH